MNRRSVALDAVKGIAIILVVIGHVLQTCIADFDKTLVHSLIFAVQMPVFMVVSGYFAIKLGEIEWPKLISTLGKKLVAYIVPFISWIIVFRPVIAGSNPLQELVNIFPANIDAGLWFVWVVFFLSCSTSIAQMVALKITQKGVTFLVLILFVGLQLPWIVIVALFGMRSLGAKLVLYYSIFYLAGILYRLYGEKLLNKHPAVKNVLFTVFLIIGVTVAKHGNVFADSDGIKTILERLISGVCLSFSLLWICEKYNDCLHRVRIDWIGKFTLEIYYVHGVAFALLAQNTKPLLYTVEGQITMLLSILLTCFFTALIIVVVKSNWLTDLIFFGKMKRGK